MINILRFIKILYCALSIWLSKRDRNGKIRKLLQNNGPVFIKFGQNLSCRADLIGKDLADELSVLCDSVSPYKFSLAKETIESELQTKSDELFAKIDPEPAGSASIAQVHKAQMTSGEIVAIKILRPNIEVIFRKDIQLIYFLASILQYFANKRFKLLEIVKTFERMTKLELDLRFEAANCVELKEGNANIKEFYVPKVYWHLTARRVLTTEWIEGKPITSVTNNPEVARNLALIFFQQAYRNGFFHGDMHAGNLILMPDGVIAAVDFGIMGRLSDTTRFYVTEILRGFINRDYQYVADIHYLAGYVSICHDDFATACMAIGEPLVGKRADQISVGALLAQLFKITGDFNMEVQIPLLLLQKTTVVVEGICSAIDPQINLWEIFRPHTKDFTPGFKKKLCKSTQIKMLKLIPELAQKYRSLIPKRSQNESALIPYLKWISAILTIHILAQIFTFF